MENLYQELLSKLAACPWNRLKIASQSVMDLQQGTFWISLSGTEIWCSWNVGFWVGDLDFFAMFFLATKIAEQFSLNLTA